jgi:hypothetical protein
MPDLNLKNGTTTTATAQTYVPGGGKGRGLITDPGATWVTSNAGVCSVSTAGPSGTCVLTGVSVGTCNVTITGSNSSTCVILVTVYSTTSAPANAQGCSVAFN